MKKIYSIIALLLSTTAFAITSMVIEGKKVECQKIGAKEYKCIQDGNYILVKNTGYDFSGVALVKNSFPKMIVASEVVEDKKILFQANKFASLKSFSGPENLTDIDSISNRYMSAKNIIENWSRVNDPAAKELLNKMQSYVTEQGKIRNKLIIEGEDKQKQECTRSEDKVASQPCSLYICVNNNNEKSLSIIPPIGSFGGAYCFTPNKDNPRVQDNGIKVFDPNSSENIPFISNPKVVVEKIDTTAQIQLLQDGAFPMPKNFRGNEESFKFFTDDMTSFNIKAEADKCKLNEEHKKLLADKDAIKENIKEDISKLELSHYLTFLNGQIISLAVDMEKSKSMGCRYNGMILSDSMMTHLSFIDKSTPKLVDKYLSIKEVQDLYKKAKSMSDIPFEYKYDGCYARAHVMARRFEAMGIPVEKAWIKGNLSVPGTDIQWNYHVAPVINVKDEKGNLVKYIIDPSLNDKAVPLDTWVNTMAHDVKGEVVKTPYPFPVNIAAFQRTAVAISSSDVYVPDNDEKRSEAQNMKLAISTMAEYKKALAEGKSL